MTFKKFDLDSKCVKCDGTTASIKWTQWYEDTNLCRNINLKGGLMERICVYCGFKWYENPLDGSGV